MTRSDRLIAQIRGPGHDLTAPTLLARSVATTAQANGWRCVDFTAEGDWASAPLERLASLPDETPVIVHLGADLEGHIRDVEPPGPVLLAHVGGDMTTALTERWHDAAVGAIASTHDAEAALVDLGIDPVHRLADASWFRYLQSLQPDPGEASLIAAHAGPHLTAAGAFTSSTATTLVNAASALVQHLRPGATMALLTHRPMDAIVGWAHQVAELGLAACQLTPSSTPEALRSHLDASAAYVATPPLHLDPGVALARALGIPVVAPDPAADVEWETAVIADLAAAMDVAIGLDAHVAATEPDDRWLWPLFAAGTRR